MKSLHRLATWLRFLAPAVLAIAAWQTLSITKILNPLLVPSPWEVAQSLWNDRRELWDGMSLTALSAALGFFASATLGIAAAIVLSLSPTLLRFVYPYTVILQTIPIIAIAPLLVIWFGYGTPTVIASTFLASIFPILTASVSGLGSTDRALLDLFRLYQASKWETLKKLILPAAVPQILIGLRISAGLAIIGAIVGEFIGGGGLGSIVDVARTQQRIDKVFAAVLLASALGMLSIAAVSFLNRRILRKWGEKTPSPLSRLEHTI